MTRPFTDDAELEAILEELGGDSVSIAGGEPFPGKLDSEDVDVDIDDDTVVVIEYELRVATSRVADVVADDVIEVNGEQFQVLALSRDRLGYSTLRLVEPT